MKKRTQRRQPTRRRRKVNGLRQSSSSFSTINLAQIISGFLSIRTAVKELNSSLKRIESIMDNTYRVLELGQTLWPQMRKSLPLHSDLDPDPDSFQQPLPNEEDMALINPPTHTDREGGSQPTSPAWGKLFEKVDMKQIFSLMQSPFAQKLLSQMLQSHPKPSTSAKISTRKKR